MTTTLTHTEMLKECGKALLMARESKQSKEKLQHDIEACVVSWSRQQSISVLGFIFPQTTTHESTVVTVTMDNKRSTPKEVKEVMNDTILKHVAAKLIETYHTCRTQKKDVAWTWPVIEMYIHQYYQELKTTEMKAKPEQEQKSMKIRISVAAPRGAKTTSVEEPKNNAYVVVSFPITDPLLQQLYNYLLDYNQVNESLKVVRHENVKLKESILRNVTEQHQRQLKQPQPPQEQQTLNNKPKPGLPDIKYSESIALKPKNESTTTAEAREIKFDVHVKSMYSTTRITKDTYLSTLRVKHVRAKTEFESMLTIPIVKSISSHPFYLFLHNELQQCRQQIYQSTHPDVPLTRANLRVGLKRKRNES